MNFILKIISLFCLVSFVTICSDGETSLPYKITGELITIEPDAPTGSSVAESALPDKTPVEPIDLANATLTISYETTNKDGDAETVTLFEGPYHEDFSQVVDTAEPTEVQIALQVTEDSDPLTINVVIGTSDIHLAFIDRPGPQDEFWLVGAARHAMNIERQFSVSGDLSFLDVDLTNTTSVKLHAIVYDEEGTHHVKQWGPVLVKNNTFLIEGDIDRPTTAQLYIHGAHNAYTTIVLEPQRKFIVGQLGTQTQEISAISGSGYHAMVVESWQQTDRYIALIEAYATEYDEYLRRREAGIPEPEVSDDEYSNVVEDETDIDESTNLVDRAEKIAPVEGCEDAVAEKNTNPSSSSSYSPPTHSSLYARAQNFRNEKLKEIAEDDLDPMASYLAINMHPYDWSDYASEIATLQRLAKEFDEKFVSAFITPKIDGYEQRIVLVQNDAALIPGQKVPEFAIANYEGSNVELYDILSENDMVLIDFWASWCGPCIAEFPELKKLHTAYTDENFEIVGVSIDSTIEDWKGSVDEHELPWINLADIQGSEGPVSTLYGINAIPKTFLVDSKGCIYKKDIRPAVLKEFLVDRYGKDESLVEPESESDDTT